MANQDLFVHASDLEKQAAAPLAERMRPHTLEEFVGQEHLVGTGKLLRQALAEDRIPSMILWGPPGTGKTTLARIIAQMTQSVFVQFSAVTTGVKELRAIVDAAQDKWKFHRQRTIVFIDEIHRWNKGQQDALLPHVEEGTVVLIGATTENPSFSINSALLSRSRVLVLNALESIDLLRVMKRALTDTERGLGNFGVSVSEEELMYLSGVVSGDARAALNTLELAVQHAKAAGRAALEREDITQALQRTPLLYDRAGEEHYNIISALHKTMRASDPDGALYWLGRMLEAGEDPLYVMRRIVRFASEDIGNADPQALIVCVAALQTCQQIGLPECKLAIAQAVVYCARAPKSRHIDDSYMEVVADLQAGRLGPVPLHIRNAPTQLMKELGYGKKDTKRAEQGNPNLPESVANKHYYHHYD